MMLMRMLLMRMLLLLMLLMMMVHLKELCDYFKFEFQVSWWLVLVIIV
jgi:hypothetical protein